jgi:methionyl-tRNA formyltransferase
MHPPTLKIGFLTTDDPLYLPVFFDHVLGRCRSKVQTVFVVPPLYKKQTPLQAALRYARTFGLVAAGHLTARVLQAKLRKQSIESACRRHGVACEEAADVNAPEFLERLRRQAPDLLVSVSCPQIFKKPLIQLPARGILNIHGAILPQYGGVMPSFWMLANGEKQAGVSIFFVNEKIDAGDLCGQRVFDITPEDTLDSFLKRSKAIAADLLLEVLEQMELGKETRTPLDLSKGSYYSWPDAEAVKRFRAAGRKVW